MGIYEKKHRLYREYVTELEAVSGRRLFNSETEIRKTVDAYINEEYARWMNIWADDGQTLAGFLIVCREPECHEHADYYIAQAYVSPEYRGQKLMQGRLDEYMKTHAGTYCLHVLKGNESVARFWDHHFLDHAGYRKSSLKDEEGKNADLILLSYKPKKAKK